MSEEKCYSWDGETFNDTEIEEAIEMQLQENTEVGDVLTVWEGEKANVDYLPSASLLLESMRESVWDQHGEFSDGWLTESTSVMVAELQTGLNSLVQNWVDAHGLAPKFYGIKNSKEIEVKITSLSEGCGFTFDRLTPSE